MGFLSQDCGIGVWTKFNQISRDQGAPSVGDITGLHIDVTDIRKSCADIFTDIKTCPQNITKRKKQVV